MRCNSHSHSHIRMYLHRKVLALTAILLGTCHSDKSCSFNDVLPVVTRLPGSNVRPVWNWKTPTTVGIDLSLYSIINL
ncbi:hypothetical protein GDO81_024556, partial [Engystomops pustulosus]